MVKKLTLPIALKTLPEGKKSLLICRIELEKVQELGKKFRWKNPGRCLVCGSTRLWGHGFVLRYFFGFASGVWIKRWRCPECGSVHTVRPESFLPGMQYPKSTQRSSLESKLAGKSFLKTVSRQIQQHWWRTFRHLCRESGNWTDLRKFLTEHLLPDQLPVTKRRIYRASWPTAVSPYLPFALTVRPPPFSFE
ncbi:DUF6431 domain-containing protein [Marispirochaeta aestuarii]|uniref:DUF6431 domain-containing protein n=1 Tax=Marispirochaeta aestuarii TaxID=1963862 RepID=UPI0026D848FF